MKTAVVLQPGYMPWLGFFDLMYQSDVFVYYDDVQFDKHGWRNRNRVKSSAGEPTWLTVPILTKGSVSKRNLDIEINNTVQWARKQLGTLTQYYSKAPYFHQYYPEVETLLKRDWKFLIDLDYESVQMICGWLGLKPTIVRSSELNIEGQKTDRLIRICKHLRADRYISGNAAKAYLEPEQFQRAGIELKWHDYEPKVYNQLFGDFVPYLSVLDLILNAGPDSLRLLVNENDRVSIRGI